MTKVMKLVEAVIYTNLSINSFKLSSFQFLDIRRRIELLQDFEMPIASTNVCVSADKQYIMASGEDCFLQ